MYTTYRPTLLIHYLAYTTCGPVYKKAVGVSIDHSMITGACGALPRCIHIYVNICVLYEGEALRGQTKRYICSTALRVALGETAAMAAHRLAAPRARRASARLAARDRPDQQDSPWTVESELPEDFRGESALMWQQGGYPDWESYAVALRETHAFVAERDQAGFLRAMGPEDGAFGAQCTRTADGKLVSRDLLDSANELSFLEERLGLRSWPKGTTLVDIGGGYGRWGHRVSQALPQLRVLSTDGVGECLACAERYLRYRGVPAECAQVVPPDKIEGMLARNAPRPRIHSPTPFPTRTLRVT